MRDIPKKFKEDKSMSELQNENTEVMISEDVNTTPATEESKDDSLGKLGIALIGLAAVGTYTLGKAAVKGGMKLVEKVKEKRADLKRFKDSKDADYREAEPEETDEDQDETENEK
jgi:hypothetical protein